MIDNDRIEEETLNERSEEARARAEKVLGKGVHPAAVERLFELWPEAEVGVRHFAQRGDDGIPLRTTRVEIWNKPMRSPGAYPVTAYASCRTDTDQWNRRFGIDLAFRRALRSVKTAYRQHH